MSLDLKSIGGYGAGNDTFSVDNTTKFNSYAQITQIEENSITISTTNYSAGNYQTFNQGDEVMIHVSALKSGSNSTKLGTYFIATISAANTNSESNSKELTLTKSPTEILGTDILSNYYIQAITIPSFKDFSIDDGVTIQPIAFDASKFIGGILAFKCNGDLTFNGGNIKLSDLGIPTTQKVMRPIQTQEQSGTGLQDVNKWAGHENWMTRDRLLLNCGDGVAFIVSKTITGDENSRIGNPESYGVHYCRGASDSVGGKPSNTTNIGGSTIFVACDTFTKFNAKMISKYRQANSASGQGLARCYIASKESTLKLDEGLYAFDIVLDPSKVVSKLNIRNFGSGSLGDVTNLTSQMNNYAKITAVSSDGFRLTYTGKTSIGLAPISTGAMIMVLSSQSLTDATEDTAEKVGKFRIASILSDNGTTITIDKSVSDILNPATHSCQIVSIPQFQNYTLSVENIATPKFNNSIGGIFAIAVKNHCNISNGKIRTWQKGGGSKYGSAGLNCIGNSQNSERIPIGQGYGSVFILANKITMNSNTRIGGYYSGAMFGGAGQQRGGNYGAVIQSGYRGQDYEVYGGSLFQRSQGNRPGVIGGNGMNSNGTYTMSGYFGAQGAHIMLIADTIDGFNLAALSTGGFTSPQVGYGARWETDYDSHGGASYGSGGVDNGYGASSGGFVGAGGGGAGGDPICAGGSGGFAFIYCNNFTNPSQTGITI